MIEFDDDEDTDTHFSRNDTQTADENFGSFRDRFAGPDPDIYNGGLSDRYYDPVPDRTTSTIPDRQMVPDQYGAGHEVFRKRQQPGYIEFICPHFFIALLLQVKTGTMPRLLNMEL